MTRFQDVLLGLRTQIPESLLAGRGWDRLLQRIGGLPAAAAASLCGFELKLDDPEPAADFSGVVTPGPVARYYIANGKSAAATPTDAWLSRRLTDSSGTDDWSDWMLLAYDIVDIPSEQPVTPVVYLSPLPGRQPGCIASTSDRLAGTLARAAGRSNDDHERRALARALKALPAEAALVFVAATPSRNPRSIRLVVADIQASAVGPFLDQLSWPGSVPTVVEFLSGMQDLSDRFMLALDVAADGALPRLGFEMYPARRNFADRYALLTSWLTTTRADWKGLADRLVDMKLCLPAKAAGLLSWPRHQNVYGNNEVFRLYMGINHVKISMAGERLRAKAYAGLRLLPLGPVQPKETAASSGASSV